MKQTFLERLTGTIMLKKRSPDFDQEDGSKEESRNLTFGETPLVETTEGELTVDVYQTADSIVIQAMVAGVSSEDLSVSITREMVTIRGKRDAPKGITSDNYFFQELYWGAFSRTILLPTEIDIEEAEATEKHGLLTVKLPKIDKGRTQTVKIKSI